LNRHRLVAGKIRTYSKGDDGDDVFLLLRVFRKRRKKAVMKRKNNSLVRTIVTIVTLAVNSGRTTG